MEKAKFDAMIKFMREDAREFPYVLSCLDEYEEEGADEFPEGGVINSWGTRIDYDDAVSCMDDEIREELNFELAPCSDQEFFSAYEKAHEKKFGEIWELSKERPEY